MHHFIPIMTLAMRGVMSSAKSPALRWVERKRTERKWKKVKERHEQYTRFWLIKTWKNFFNWVIDKFTRKHRIQIEKYFFIWWIKVDLTMNKTNLHWFSFSFHSMLWMQLIQTSTVHQLVRHTAHWKHNCGPQLTVKLTLLTVTFTGKCLFCVLEFVLVLELELELELELQLKHNCTVLS